MHPRLIHFGHFSLPTYGALLACAYLIAIGWAMRKAASRGISSERVADLGITILFASLVGSKMTLFLLTPQDFLSPDGVVRLLRSGGVFYGGLIAATVFGLWTLRRRKLPLWPVADLLAPSVALGEAIGRIGCLSAGCCYGRPASVPWAITFTDPYTLESIGTPLGIPLHPTQIYLSLGALSIFFLLELLDRRRRFDGQVFWSYVLLHGATRFVIELYRGDEVRGFLIADILSTSQALSLATLAVATGMLFYLGRKTPTTGEPASA